MTIKKYHVGHVRFEIDELAGLIVIAADCLSKKEAWSNT
jgi:hypothetical protein